MVNRRITEFAEKIASSHPDLAYDLLRIGMDFPTEEALRKYLEKHPKADPKNHTVKKDSPSEKDPPAKSKMPPKAKPNPRWTEDFTKAWKALEDHVRENGDAESAKYLSLQEQGADLYSPDWASTVRFTLKERKDQKGLALFDALAKKQRDLAKKVPWEDESKDNASWGEKLDVDDDGSEPIGRGHRYDRGSGNH